MSQLYYYPKKNHRRKIMSKNEDLHGNAPDKSKVALLLIDVINDFDFDDGDKLLENSLPMEINFAQLQRAFN